MIFHHQQDDNACLLIVYHTSPIMGVNMCTTRTLLRDKFVVVQYIQPHTHILNT